jgi:hypothetical protein
MAALVRDDPKTGGEETSAEAIQTPKGESCKRKQVGV